MTPRRTRVGKAMKPTLVTTNQLVAAMWERQAAYREQLAIRDANEATWQEAELRYQILDSHMRANEWSRVMERRRLAMLAQLTEWGELGGVRPMGHYMAHAEALKIRALELDRASRLADRLAGLPTVAAAITAEVAAIEAIAPMEHMVVEPAPRTHRLVRAPIEPAAREDQPLGTPPVQSGPRADTRSAPA